MTLRPRPSLRPRALVAAVTLPILLLAACGNDVAAEPEPYLLTDLDGTTAAPDAVLPTATDSPSERPTRRPPRTPRAEPSPTDDPSATPAATAPSAAELVAAIAAAAGRVETVQITIGPPSAPSGLQASVAYGADDAFDASLVSAPGEPTAFFRRIGGTLYAGPSGGLEAVDPTDPRVADAAGGVVPAFLAWSPLADLRAVLEGATDISPGVSAELDGVPVTTFTFTVDATTLPRPSLVVPDDAAGSAQASIALDAELLPRQLVLALDSGETVVVGYSAWGGRVQITTPPAPSGG